MDLAEQGLLLEQQLCFDVYAASRAINKAYRPLLEALSLTYPQYLVMLVLWEHEAQTVKQLGEQLQLDSGTLSPLLKRLESAGFLQRQRRASDEREVEIQLTEAGRALRQQASNVPASIFQAIGLSAAEYLQLKHLLRQVMTSVEANYPD
ncbi:MAG TPA: MarR family transcriptional regulator [Herpetosiphon sp.]|uniref:Transcriptional regulator, MarR family n=1 Tax=Herpetosiphon aurantiacus (strain ATCC 23779 / DSM 785 / 114-95) TaxID=316274 RepID=A9B6S6_HERA2|nr:MarR family transcriptional regulator [Herpetosiphon sp.]ABX04385.1 transcriptional regulator, MarR family [Herpetosiphon aurantiacus DSM 785]HBW52360.1 MarR family transcriptional regulator [Herpetosiphon sp.]